MRIKTANHPFYGRLQKRFVSDGVDVVVLDSVEHAGELSNFLKRKFFRSLLGGIRLQPDARERADAYACADERKRSK